VCVDWVVLTTNFHLLSIKHPFTLLFIGPACCSCNNVDLSDLFEDLPGQKWSLVDFISFRTLVVDT